MNARIMLKISTSCAIALLMMISDLHAGIMPYQITVEVTAAPTVPGTFPSNPWSFPDGVPATFVGTFDADDTVPGPISDLALTIGGLDIASTHPLVPIPDLDFEFDPSSLTLVYVGVDPSGAESAVIFGAFDDIVPANYAVAIQNSQTPPIDPFLGSTQNWVGTFSVVSAVPEPTSLAIWSLMGFVAVGQRRRRQ